MSDENICNNGEGLKKKKERQAKTSLPPKLMVF